MSKEAKLRDDTKAYTDALGDIPAEASYQDEETENGMRHYSGSLGDFDYDPKQFQVQMVSIPESDYGPASQMECLRYVGEEKDGSKIKIPKGVINANFMFAGTDIETAPKIDAPIETAFHMFGNCKNLKEANIILPPTLKETPFMFNNCEKLERGPKVIPGSVKQASYMFANCSSLKNTPLLGNGIEDIDGTFAWCKSLKKTPHIPKSALSADDITIGCENMDKSEKDATDKARDKAREKYAKKLDKPSFMQRMGGAFSAVMQIYSLRKMGYGVVAAPLMVHAYRKSGSLGRDMGAGVSMLAMTKGGPMAHVFYRAGLARSQKLQAKQEARKTEKLAQWDRLYGDGSDFHKRTKAMSLSGKRDHKNNLFRRILEMNSHEMDILRESHGNSMIARAQAERATGMFESGCYSVVDKKASAAWFKDRLSERRAYALESKELINNDASYSERDKEEALAGLEIMNKIATKDLVSTMKSLQAQMGLFDVRDQKDIDKMMRDITGESVFEIDAREQSGRTDGSYDKFSFSRASRDDVFEEKGTERERTIRMPVKDDERQVFINGVLFTTGSDDLMRPPKGFNPVEMDISAKSIERPENMAKANIEAGYVQLRNPNPAERDKQLFIKVSDIAGLPLTDKGTADFDKISEMAKNGQRFSAILKHPNYLIGEDRDAAGELHDSFFTLDHVIGTFRADIAERYLSDENPVRGSIVGKSAKETLDKVAEAISGVDADDDKTHRDAVKGIVNFEDNAENIINNDGIVDKSSGSANSINGKEVKSGGAKGTAKGKSVNVINNNGIVNFGDNSKNTVINRPMPKAAPEGNAGADDEMQMG